MVTEVIETPVETAPEVQPVETDAPTPVVEGDAPAAEPAAEPLQVEVTEPEKPEYMTRADWEREKESVAKRAADEALEADRRRRQTENARRAAQEKRDTEDRAELIDTVKAAFGAQGIYEVPDEAVIKAIDRTVSKRAAQLGTQNLDVIESALDYITAPAFGQQVDLSDDAEPAARRLAPKIQSLIDQIRPQIEAKAREGYIAESDLPKRVEAEIARRNAKGREGQTELKRPEGTVSSNRDNSPQAIINRIISGEADDKDREAYPDARRQVLMQGR